MLEQLLEAWRTNHRISLFLIDRISDEGMKRTLSKRGGRNVVRQFAHLHNVRVWHLEARAKDLAKGLYKFETDEEPDKSKLKECLTASADRIETFFAECAAGAPKRRPFKKGIVSTLGYFIAHESHHRGSILLTLKECGHKVDQETAYAIWDWDRM
ncbi:MAG TPA: DinB family protein [Terriglobia bacterium]|nr:DinB family protein [Terriglobia bacterium]